MGHHVFEVVGGQPQVQLYQGGCYCRNTKVQLQAPQRVPIEHANGTTWTNAQVTQHIGQLLDAASQFSVVTALPFAVNCAVHNFALWEYSY